MLSISSINEWNFCKVFESLTLGSIQSSFCHNSTSENIYQDLFISDVQILLDYPLSNKTDKFVSDCSESLSQLLEDFHVFQKNDHCDSRFVLEFSKPYIFRCIPKFDGFLTQTSTTNISNKLISHYLRNIWGHLFERFFRLYAASDYMSKMQSQFIEKNYAPMLSIYLEKSARVLLSYDFLFASINDSIKKVNSLQTEEELQEFLDSDSCKMEKARIPLMIRRQNLLANRSSYIELNQLLFSLKFWFPSSGKRVISPSPELGKSLEANFGRTFFHLLNRIHRLKNDQRSDKRYDYSEELYSRFAVHRRIINRAMKDLFSFFVGKEKEILKPQSIQPEMIPIFPKLENRSHDKKENVDPLENLESNIDYPSLYYGKINSNLITNQEEVRVSEKKDSHLLTKEWTSYVKDRLYIFYLFLHNFEAFSSFLAYFDSLSHDFNLQIVSHEFEKRFSVLKSIVFDCVESQPKFKDLLERFRLHELEENENITLLDRAYVAVEQFSSQIDSSTLKPSKKRNCLLSDERLQEFLHVSTELIFLSSSSLTHLIDERMPITKSISGTTLHLVIIEDLRPKIERETKKDEDCLEPDDYLIHDPSSFSQSKESNKIDSAAVMVVVDELGADVTNCPDDDWILDEDSEADEDEEKEKKVVEDEESLVRQRHKTKIQIRNIIIIGSCVFGGGLLIIVAFTWINSVREKQKKRDIFINSHHHNHQLCCCNDTTSSSNKCGVQPGVLHTHCHCYDNHKQEYHYKYENVHFHKNTINSIHQEEDCLENKD
eukprot:GDKJ01004470.1.p1 GENE.GDKJ01004470.1~~GDKJ01004470.1.p1  ORF type:complete len:773 (+),score=133.38 GDKJ01004470.1:46-2364(+)